MLAELKQKEAEVKSKLEEEETKLQQLQVDNEVKIAEALVKAYNNFNVLEGCEEVSEHKFLHDSQNTEYNFFLNPQATPFQPGPISSNPLKAQEGAGDPLKYADWKISFMTLIGEKPLPTSEKMFYLKSYLAGEAHKAVEGFFLSQLRGCI